MLARPSHSEAWEPLCAQSRDRGDAVGAKRGLASVEVRQGPQSTDVVQPAEVEVKASQERSLPRMEIPEEWQASSEKRRWCQAAKVDVRLHVRWVLACGREEAREPPRTKVPPRMKTPGFVARPGEVVRLGRTVEPSCS